LFSFCKKKKKEFGVFVNLDTATFQLLLEALLIKCFLDGEDTRLIINIT